MPVKIIAFVTVKPGSEDAFVEIARTCAAGSRNEAGMLRYDLWRESDGERRYVFTELYSDDAAVESHMGSTHFKAFGLAARDLATTRPVILRSDPIDVVE